MEFTKPAVEPTVENGSNSKNKKAEDLYASLIEKAPYVSGDYNPLVPTEEIEWLDKSLLEHSYKFYKKYATLAIAANTFALLFGFCVKPNTAVLVRTGKLHDPELSFRRYLSTIQRIGKFFMFPINPTKAFKSFDVVRKMHKLASKKTLEHHPSAEQLGLSEPWKVELAQAVRNDLQHIDTQQAPVHLLTWDPQVPVSQFDMAVTQFGFIGVMWLFPRAFGITNRSEEMKGIIHVWAIFGRLLGIKDEFNVCLKPDPVLYDMLFRNIIVESFKTMDETVVTIQSTFVEALSKRLPFLTYKGMLFHGMSEVEGFKGESLWQIMTFWDKLSLKILQIWFWAMRNIALFRIFMNLMTGLWLYVQFWIHLETKIWD